MGGFDFTTGLVVVRFFLQGSDLCIVQRKAFVCYFFFECFEPLTEVLEAVPLPDGANTTS